MQIFILSPNTDILFNKSLKSSLENAGEVIYIQESQSIKDIKELHNSNEKILAIDPDFCGWKVSNKDLNNIPNIRAVCLQTTSFSWIDTSFLKNKNIPVVNLRGFSTEAVAEWAFMMALNIARKIPLVIQQNWKHDYKLHTGIELKNRTAGIIGLGSIGKRIAEICQGFGMNVVYWSKNSRDNRFDYLELEDLMETADVIFPAVARNETTNSLINDEMLKSMKQNSIFISIVNKIYNHKLLLELVEQGHVYGYANEAKGSKTPGLSSNIWTGLQLGWCTEESLERNVQQWVKSIINANEGKYPTKVN